MINTSAKTNNLLLKDTIDMLFGLDDAKLKEVQTFILENSEETEEELYKGFFKPQTEAELLERIDKAIAEVDAGNVIDSETMEKELIAKFGL